MALGVLICGEKIVIERKGKPVNGESHFRFQSMIEGAINVFWFVVIALELNRSFQTRSGDHDPSI